MLFAMEAQTLQERQAARRTTIDDRVNACAEIVNSTDDICLVWCDLNDESASLHKAISGSVEVKGSDSSEYKERVLLNVAQGKIMASPASPSVVVLENNQSIFAPNVDSSSVGIVGFADKGPINEATLVTSQNDLLNKPVMSSHSQLFCIIPFLVYYSPLGTK